MKIFIFGKNGMLGNTVYLHLSQYYSVIAFDRSNYNPLVDSSDDLGALLKSNKLSEDDIIINCLGMIPQKKATDSLEYFKVNSQFPHFLSYFSSLYKAKYIHISTNCVFSSSSSYMNENSLATADDTYGISKLLGEPANATTIRTSIIGEEIHTNYSLLSWALSMNKTVNGYTNHLWNGVTCLQLSKYIQSVIETKSFWSGVRHVYSQETVSKYDLLKMIYTIYNNTTQIIPVPTEYSVQKLLSSIYSHVSEIPSLYQQITEQKLFFQIQKIQLCRLDIQSNCRFCYNKTIPWFKFDGMYPLAGGFLNNTAMDQECKIPLNISLCRECQLLQCDEVVSSDILFKKGYFYFSSMIPFLVHHFKSFSELLKKEYSDPLQKKYILEIGCNDGVLLRNLDGEHFKTIGVDPSHTVNTLVKDGYTIYNEYFTKETAEKILRDHGQIDIFISSNSFAHINDMKNILDGLKLVLKKDGTAIIEVHNSLNILTKLNFDFIYHEHMTYYTKTSFCKIFERIGMHVERIDDIDVHGGSMRVFIKNSQQLVNSISYSNSLISDSNEFLLQLDRFPTKLYNWKKEFQKLFISLKQAGKTIFGYGASGRANMFLRFLDIDIDGIVDDAKSKIGAYMPFTHTEIKSSSSIYDMEKMPDYIILISWAYKDAILEKHDEYLKRGGKFIIPLPTIEVIEKSKEFF